MDDKDREIAASSLLFSSIPGPARDAMLCDARTQTFDRGATIFLQGEPARAIYVVVEGWAKLYRIAPNGAEAVVGVFTRGQSFGEPVALRDDSYPVSAEAVTYCRLIRLPADSFRKAVREDPDIALATLSATFSHLHSLVAQIEALKSRTGAQRLAEFLLALSDCKDGRCEVRLPYDKALIAGRLGMKPESLSRAFQKLRDVGVTVNQNLAELADLQALRNYAEEDPAQSWAR